MDDESLRFVETNASDSEVTIWGLRFDVLWLGLSGFLGSFVILAAMLASEHAPVPSIACAAVPAAFTLGFALFRQTHPPGHDGDLLDLFLNGPGFGPQALPDDLS